MAQMTTREYTVRFPTPAFLGDAEQNGRWRTVAGRIMDMNRSKRVLP
jgi:hypothetical protein